MIYNIYDKDTLFARVQTGFQPKYLFFWGHRAREDGKIGKPCFSQWWPAPFEIDGLTYPTAEHYMMAEKARLFGDEDSCQKIMAVSHPNAAKKLGRGVNGFNEKVWDKHRFDIVVRGNTAKFGQHAAMKTYLLSTKNRILVEASPVDRVWGIGLAEDDSKATNPALWQGFNLLGFALMKVRDQFRMNNQ